MATENATLSSHDALIFSTVVCAIATAMLWTGKISGAEWVSTVTWVTSALIVGKAATLAASGYATAKAGKEASSS